LKINIIKNFGYFSSGLCPKNIRNLISIFIFMAFLPAGQPSFPSWQAKVDPRLLTTQGATEFLVYLTEQADISAAARLPTKVQRAAYVYQQLSQTAHRSQAPLLAALQQRGVAVRTYWIANLLWVRGDNTDLQFIAQRREVAHIYPNPHLHQELPKPSAAPTFSQPAAVEWNIEQVNTPAVWSLGFSGQGAVIAGQDTGYQWDHPALKNQYRGWNGSAADHNYNWHDAIHADDPHTSPGNPCGFDAQAPCDDSGHGTHTMGIMTGDDGAGEQIGMAPGARWIGCRNMEQGWGSPATYIECFQWFVAPTDLAGNNPRPDLAPDVINNSWTCPAAEGCSWNSLQPVVENTRAAGIFVAVAASNAGPSCETISDPPSIYDASFSVGATDSSNHIASFSSRGPVTVDGSGRLKPDISAPGVNIYSSTLNNSYVMMSGTSMATPHVAGLVALLISANPALRGQVDQLEALITQSALPSTTTETCGSVPGSQVPNNTYGWGRIDAFAALQSARPDLFQHYYLPLVAWPALP
jgi:serine protease AprX